MEKWTPTERRGRNRWHCPMQTWKGFHWERVRWIWASRQNHRRKRLRRKVRLRRIGEKSVRKPQPHTIETRHLEENPCEALPQNWNQNTIIARNMVIFENLEPTLDNPMTIKVEPTLNAGRQWQTAQPNTKKSVAGTHHWINGAMKKAAAVTQITVLRM